MNFKNLFIGVISEVSEGGIMKKHKGQVIVEFALILPLFLLMLLGIVYSGMMFHDYITLSNIARSGAREAAITSEAATEGRYTGIEDRCANQIENLMTSFYVIGNPPVVIQETSDDGIQATINMKVNVSGYFVDMILPKSFGVQYYMKKEPANPSSSGTSEG